MARARRQPKHYWRCAQCHNYVPIKYTHCGNCGTRSDARPWEDTFIECAKRIFPGSYEPK